MKTTITLGIIDDDALFAEALCSLLQTDDSFPFLFNVSNKQELFTAIEEDGLPDVLICDLKLKTENGLDVLAELLEQHPGVKAIALSSFYKPAYIAAGLRNGFSAFLPKHCSSPELTKAIRCVHETGIYYRAEDLGLIREFLRNPQMPKPDFSATTPLSDRETEIVVLICQQYTNVEIAEKLFISVRTVEGHRIRILEKTGVRNSAGLVVFAITCGILDISELTLREDLKSH